MLIFKKSQLIFEGIHFNILRYGTLHVTRQMQHTKMMFLFNEFVFIPMISWQMSHKLSLHTKGPITPQETYYH